MGTTITRVPQTDGGSTWQKSQEESHERINANPTNPQEWQTQYTNL